MPTIYLKQCSFCEEVFDVGTTDYQPMEVHIAEKHRDDQEDRIGYRPPVRFQPKI